MFTILVSTDIKNDRRNKYAVVSDEFPDIYFVGQSLREVTDEIPTLKLLIEAKKNPPN
jgi:predicted RNase H-like HicB family nuclease